MAINSDLSDQTKLATWAHVAPFAAWLLIMALCGDPAAWKYALRVVAGVALLLALRPWRWYARPQARYGLPAVAVGVGVFALWVGPESQWLGDRWPALQDLYRRYAIGWSFGNAPEPLSTFPYSPAVCGWPLTIVRLLGSAIVIAVIEEFFWRGFLYRWFLGDDFQRRDPGVLNVRIFILVAVIFGIEHGRWLVGIGAGVAYGLLYVRTRDIASACVAHAVTNLLLGIYVVKTGAYQFW